MQILHRLQALITLCLKNASDVSGDDGAVPLEQSAHLLDGEPDGFTFQPHVQLDVGIRGLVDGNNALVSIRYERFLAMQMATWQHSHPHAGIKKYGEEDWADTAWVDRHHRKRTR